MAPTQDQLWEFVAGRSEGVLTTIKADGMPHPTNVLYIPDPAARVVRISTTAERLKARNVARDPRAVLYVAGDDFWHYAVAEGRVTVSAVAATPGDEATDELSVVHSTFSAIQNRAALDAELILERRLVVRLHVTRLYGVMAGA
jgi:PPOX class probable F420-dependent enzyme